MVKPAKIENVKSILEDYDFVARLRGMVVFAEFAGISVEQMAKLRRNLRTKDVKFRVLKNTLILKALKESGVEGADSFLKGPTAVAFSPDEISGAKILYAFAKEIERLKKDSAKLIIKGGVLEGKTVSKEEVEQFAMLPSREEVFSKLLATINAPLVNLLRLIKEPAARLARVINAAEEKKGEII